MSMDFLSAADALAQRERAKYRQMWQHAAYRLSSPGEACVERAIEQLGMRRGDSVTDFGCGTGRAAALLQRQGLIVRAIDHADNCLDPQIQVPLEVACLWHLPPGEITDYGFCADVMEHIPPERVTDVLTQIARRVRRAVFFHISTMPDSCGRLIGERLHLTVEPAAWWVARVEQAFRVTTRRQDAAAVEIAAACLPELCTGMDEP